MIDLRFIRNGFVRYGIPIVAGAMIVATLGMAARQSFRGRPIEREFTAFYVVGQILDRLPPEAIYDREIQNQVGRLVVPDARSNLNLPYSHAPFEALLYRPLAWLSHEQAYRVWVSFSLLLLCAGFALMWRTLPSMPRSWWLPALLLLLSFPPVLVRTLYPGQVAALPFFWMALALHLDRRDHPLLAGLALAPCLAKPTLLLFIVPLMLLARRWRIAAGFAAGTAALIVVSLLAVGRTGSAAYLHMLLQFGRWTGGGEVGLNTSIYMDLNAFFRVLTGGHGRLAFLLAACVGLGLLPLLARMGWRAHAEHHLWAMAWSTSLVWTTVLNVYTPIYDLALIPLAALVMIDALVDSDPRRLRTYLSLLAALYFTTFVCPMSASHPLLAKVPTLVLLALGSYQLWLALKARSRASAQRYRCCC